MNNTVKALGLVSLGLIIWSALAYIAIAFLKAETNPFIWSQDARGGMLFVIFCYVCFSPLMLMAVMDEL
jgi:hypothetical protein